jgi:hypothetical protein
MLGQVALRPRYSALRSERGLTLGRLEDAVTEYLASVQPQLVLNAENDAIFAARAA